MSALTFNRPYTCHHNVIQPSLYLQSHPGFEHPISQDPSKPVLNGPLWIPVIGSVRFPESQAPLSDPGPPTGLAWGNHVVTATTAR